MCQQRGKDHDFSKRHVICAFLIMSLKSERKNSVSHGEIFLIQMFCRTVRDGVGHGESCFLGTVKNSELGKNNDLFLEHGTRF